MSVSSPTTPSVGLPPRSLPPPIDDMQDTADDRRIWPGLASALDVCAEVVEPPFRKADKAALRHQWHHRQLIKWATVKSVQEPREVLLPDLLRRRFANTTEGIHVAERVERPDVFKPDIAQSHGIEPGLAQLDVVSDVRE
jgi:hypothetical protein